MPERNLTAARCIWSGAAIVALVLCVTPASAKDKGGECMAAPGPVVLIKGNNFYKKGTVERVPELYRKSQTDLAPVYQFQNVLGHHSNLFVQKGSQQSKSCADALLLRWAKANALTQFGSNTKIGDFQSNYVQQWVAANLGLARIKLGPLKSRRDDRVVRQWLSRLAISVYNFHDRIKYHNNHYDWAVLSVGSIGYSIRDPKLIVKAEKMFQIALNDIQDDGFIPLEIKRGEMAANYHSFAAQPLALYQLIRTRCENRPGDQLKLTKLIELVRILRKNPDTIQPEAKSKQLPVENQPWLNIWDSVNGRTSSETPAQSRYIAGNTQSLIKVFSAGCPSISYSR